MMAFGIGRLWRTVSSSSNDMRKTNHPKCPPELHNRLEVKTKKRCLRCSTLYDTRDNSPTACSFHGHTTGPATSSSDFQSRMNVSGMLSDASVWSGVSAGEKGLFSLAPPHQGIDGEWSDQSGVIVYRWNNKGNRPNTGRANWKRRWSCCAEYGEDAQPCRRGWHVSYEDGFTLY